MTSKPAARKALEVLATESALLRERDFEVREQRMREFVVDLQRADELRRAG